LRCQKKYDESIALYKSLTTAADQVMGAEHPYTLFWKSGYAWTLVIAGHSADAEPIFRQTVEIQRRRLGPDHPDTLDAQSGLGRSLLDEGKTEEAEAMLLNVMARAQIAGSPTRRTVSEVAADLFNLYTAAGKPDEAEKYRSLIDKNPLP